MKVASFFSLAIILFSGFANAATLLPTDHSACVSFEPGTNSCDRGMLFVVDQFGRCGCLYKDEITLRDACDTSLISCEDGEIFSSLYRYHDPLKTEYVGCGCFATYDPGLRDS